MISFLRRGTSEANSLASTEVSLRRGETASHPPHPLRRVRFFGLWHLRSGRTLTQERDGISVCLRQGVWNLKCNRSILLHYPRVGRGATTTGCFRSRGEGNGRAYTERVVHADVGGAARAQVEAVRKTVRVAAVRGEQPEARSGAQVTVGIVARTLCSSRTTRTCELRFICGKEGYRFTKLLVAV